MDSWERVEDNFVYNQQLANAAALHIQIEEKKRELDGLNFQYDGECALLEAKATAEYKIVLDRKKFYAKKNKQSDKHIEKTANDFWIPEAARIRDTAIEKGKRQLNEKYTSIKHQNHSLLRQLEDKLAKIEIREEEISRIVNIYKTQFCVKETFVPQIEAKGGVSNVSLELLGDNIDVLPPDLSRDSMHKAGCIVPMQERGNIGALSKSDLEILKRVVMLVRESSKNWLDAAFSETFHWHSGRPLDEYTAWFSEGEDSNTYTAIYFWNYGHSLKIAQKPPETNEFSQHLNIDLQIQSQKFNNKKASKTPSQQWKIQVGIIANHLSKPRADVNEARKLVLQMVNHPMAPSNDERNQQASKILVHILAYQLEAIRKNKSPSSADKVQLFTTIRDLHVHFLARLSESDKKMMKDGMKLLNGCSIRFQMEECGPVLLKDSQPQFYPHRDIPFIPDLWQKEVLDHIKDNKSCLIVAPTSAGKSFISFFTISHVLGLHSEKEEANDKSNKKGKHKSKTTSTTTTTTTTSTSIKASKGMKSRIVFVAPTVPLCNQMVAMVTQRYSSKVKVGVFASDYRINVQQCDVLVCTPVILEILLMSPSCEDWRLNLKYVILDEIHFTNSARISKGMSETGEEEKVERAMSDAYSRIFALLECPFLALSATIRNPEDTREWLQSVRNFSPLPEAVDRDVHLLPKDYSTLRRWVDLQTYVYTPPTIGDESKPINLSKPPEVGLLQHIHPISLLRLQGSYISDYSVIHFSTLEMVQLYDKMVEVLGDSQLKHLNPNKFLEQKPFIDCNDCRNYEKSLLAAFEALENDKKVAVASAFTFPYKIKERVLAPGLFEVSNESSSSTINNNNPKNDNKKKNNDSPAEKDKAQPKHQPYDSDHIKFTIANLISHLSHNNMLPAIAFSDDTRLMEHTLKVVVDYLESLEALHGSKPAVGKRNTNDSTFTDNDEYDDDGKSHNTGGISIDSGKEFESNKQYNKFLQQQAINVKLDTIHSEVWPVDFKYSLRKRSDTLETEGISYWLVRMIQKLDMKSKHIYIRGLARGIAIYHMGVPKPYRDLVETLFRAGNIQFVISTQALSVGVNMPCKSVVFLTDSKHIGKVEFEQMRGRAGRRGFDQVGSTVFCNFSPYRVEALLHSKLKPLLAIPALNLDSVLRAIILRNHVNNKNAVSRSVARWLYTHPSITGKGENPPADFLFSLELLFRLRLINQDCKPIGVSGLVAHNFDVYPANYAIAYLIQAKVLQKIVGSFHPSIKATKGERKQALQQLLNIFAYLAERVPVTKPQNRVLSKIPQEVHQALENYNATCYNCAKDCENPLGSKDLPVPFISLIPESTLNSYAVDFFNFKEIAPVRAENNLSDNHTYHLVTHFNSFLKKVKTAIEHGVEDPVDPLLLATKALSRKFNKYYNNIEY